MTVSADDLDEATDAVQAALEPLIGSDWSVPGTGDWTCRSTIEHIGDGLLSYAAQVAARPLNRYVRFEAVASSDASNDELLEFAVAGAHILAAVVRTADPTVRAFHPTGRSDPEGFAAMGCVEILLHGDDVARQLGSIVEPSAASCTRVLHRLFPDVTIGARDPWETLRWATGRPSTLDQPARTEWRWRGAPLDD